MPEPRSNNEVSLGELDRNLRSHLETDGKFKENMSREISLIKDNHLAHMETDLSKLQVNVEWLLKYHWIVATASIGGLIAGIVNMIKN